MRAVLAALVLLGVLVAPAAGEEGPREVPGAITSLPRLDGPLTRDDAVRVALARGLRLAMAREEAVMAAAERLAAASELRPRVSATLIGAAGDWPMIYATAPGVMPVFYAALPDRNVLELNLMGMVPLFTGGRLEAMLGGAGESEKAALARTAWQMVDTARESRAAYAEVQLAHARLDITEWQVSEASENLRLAEKRFQAGRVAQYVVLRARAERAAALQARNDARADLEVRHADLRVALSVDLASDLQVVDAAAVPPGARERDARQALQSRPDLIAARHGVAAAAYAVRAARDRYAPQVWLAAMGEGMYMDPLTREGSADGGYSVGVLASIPVVDGGERRAGVQRAEAERRLRALQMAELELEVTRQVVQANARLKAALANVELARQQVAQATEDLRVARLRFQVGRSIQLEVLDALESLAEARFAFAQAVQAATLAHADALRASGLIYEDPITP